MTAGPVEPCAVRARLRVLRRLANGRLWVLTIPLIVGISKLIGLVREALLTKLLGLGSALDLFVLFTTVPTYATSFVTGPFSLAFYASLAGPGVTSGGLARKLLPWLLAGMTVAAAVTFMAALWIAPASASDTVAMDGYGLIAAGCAATVPAAALIGLVVCMLHAEKRHSVAVLVLAAQPWLFVLCLLAVDLLLDLTSLWPVGTAYIASFTVAVVLAFLVTRAIMDRSGAGTAAKAIGLRHFGSHLGTAALETGGFFANQLLTMAFAGMAGPGAIAANALAMRIMLTPLTLLVTPLSPVLQNIYRERTGHERRSLFLRVFLLAIAGIAVLLTGITYAGEAIATFFFQRGAFGPEDTARVVPLLLPYCVYVVFMAANQLCAAVSFVAGQGALYTRTMLINYACGNLLKFPMLSAYGLEGVIWAAAMAEGAAALVNVGRQFMPRDEASA